MLLIREAKRRSRQIIAPILATAVIGYFLYHAVHGERGLFAYASLSEQVEQARAELAALRTDREALEHDVRLLRPNSLDLDMLEERARAVLNYVDEQDVVLRPERR